MPVLFLQILNIKLWADQTKNLSNPACCFQKWPTHIASIFHKTGLDLWIPAICDVGKYMCTCWKIQIHIPIHIQKYVHVILFFFLPKFCVCVYSMTYLRTYCNGRILEWRRNLPLKHWSWNRNLMKLTMQEQGPNAAAGERRAREKWRFCPPEVWVSHTHTHSHTCMHTHRSTQSPNSKGISNGGYHNDLRLTGEEVHPLPSSWVPPTGPKYSDF